MSLSEMYAPRKGNISQTGTPMEVYNTQIEDNENFHLPILSFEHKSLLHPSSLVDLDLSGCHFGTYGAAYLFDGINYFDLISIIILSFGCFSNMFDN